MRARVGRASARDVRAGVHRARAAGSRWSVGRELDRARRVDAPSMTSHRSSTEECFSTSSILMPFTSGLVSSAVIFSVGSDASVTDARVGIAEVELPTSEERRRGGKSEAEKRRPRWIINRWPTGGQSSKGAVLICNCNCKHKLTSSSDHLHGIISLFAALFKYRWGQAFQTFEKLAGPLVALLKINNCLARLALCWEPVVAVGARRERRVDPKPLLSRGVAP